MRISDWSSDVCSSDLTAHTAHPLAWEGGQHHIQRQLHHLSGSHPAGSSPALSIACGQCSPDRSRGDGHRRFDQWDQAKEAHDARAGQRSEEHTSELQSLMRISYAVFCLKTKIIT